MRILIVKTSSMGDVVHALPAISDIAAALPGVEIDWVVEKSFAAIPAQHHAIARVIPLQWRKWRRSLLSSTTQQAIRDWRAEMTRHRYDLIIDLQGLLKSAMFTCAAQGIRAGYDRRSIKEPLASIFYARHGNVPRDLHAVERCRRLCAQLLNYPMPSAPPDFGLRPQPQAWTPGKPFAVLIPCASRPEKLWPIENWVAVGMHLKANNLNVAVMWGSHEEQRIAQTIAKEVGGEVPPFLTVAQLSDTLAKASLVIGLDTGMSHIAAAHGRPTVGIYCDHEPGLAGLTGSGPLSSLGGKGQVPSLSAVLTAMTQIEQIARRA